MQCYVLVPQFKNNIDSENAQEGEYSSIQVKNVYNSGKNQAKKAFSGNFMLLDSSFCKDPIVEYLSKIHLENKIKYNFLAIYKTKNKINIFKMILMSAENITKN